MRSIRNSSFIFAAIPFALFGGFGCGIRVTALAHSVAASTELAPGLSFRVHLNP